MNINMNDYNLIHLGEEIVFWCVAQGSVKFTWYKDGMLVNTSKATRYLEYIIIKYIFILLLTRFFRLIYAI